MTRDRIERIFRAQVERWRVPGACLAVLDDDRAHVFCRGVLNVDTGVDVTADTLFQVGSITKLFTATLVMQLVDEGAVDLDVPVAEYLPGLRFGSGCTARQLLSHGSGVDGDFVEDFGRGDDALARYVEACAALEQIVPPGLLYAYSNAGFVVLGRLVEVLRERPFHVVLRERLFRPLGMVRTVALPEEAIMFRTAVGHMVRPPDLTPHRAGIWSMPWAQTPAGATVCSTVGDLLRFTSGLVPGGGEVLAAASAAAMLQPQQQVPTAVPGLDSAVGLGWHLERWRGVTEAGHTGSTLGQASVLSTVPERGLAIALLTNSLTGIALQRSLLDELWPLLGIEPAPGPSVPEPRRDLDLTSYAGRFTRSGQLVVVEPHAGSLVISTTITGRLADLLPATPPLTVTPVDDATFVGPGPVAGRPTTVRFAERDGDGRFRYIQHGRVARRV